MNFQTKIKKHFGNLLTPNFRERELLSGFINIQSLPKTHRGEDNFYILHLMSYLKFDHIGIA